MTGALTALLIALSLLGVVVAACVAVALVAATFLAIRLWWQQNAPPRRPGSGRG